MRRLICKTISNTRKINRRILIGSTFALGLITGCQSTNFDDLKPAILVDPSNTTHSQLKAIIVNELGAQDVRIAESSFVNTSSIVIVKHVRQTIESDNIQGRDMQQPVRFKLMKSDNNCYLVRVSNAKHWRLDNISCQYE